MYCTTIKGINVVILSNIYSYFLLDKLLWNQTHNRSLINPISGQLLNFHNTSLEQKIEKQALTD